MARSRRRNLPTTPVTATIESLSHDGRGVAHIDGKATFIHGALPGEEVSFTYTARQRRMDEGVVQEVLKPSPDRVEPKCPHFGVCGGCALQHLRPEMQILSKQQVLLDAFEHIGKVEPAEILEPLVNENPWGYRTKARLGVKDVQKKGRVLVGFRERGSSFLSQLTRCEVLHPLVGERIEPLAAMIESLTIREQIPQVEVAIGEHEAVLVFRVLAPPSFDDERKMELFGAEYGFRIYQQSGGLDTVRPVARKEARLTYSLPEYHLEYQFLPNDFTQVNLELNRRMVHRAVGLLAPEPEDRVLDLFCGLGNFTLPLARKAREVVGVEGESGLVNRARDNAQRNGIRNVAFFTANLFEAVDKEPWMRGGYDKALLDPPRNGALEILEPLAKLGPKRIVYVSCYPGTLARDAGELVNKHRYKLVSAGVMDMFPHTNHVESIALFERR